MGWASEQLSAVSLLFVEQCRPAAVVLDIGAGFGAASVAALRAGAVVMANDIDVEPLENIEGLRIVAGRFPDQIDFEDGSFDAVNASSVLHFLKGPELEGGMRKVARWLKPGGKLFAQTASPYMLPFAAFVPEYARRVERGLKWPGWIAKASEWSTHRLLGQMPREIHLLDDRVLTRVAEDAGLRVERAWMYRRGDLPESLRFDGRESAGLVAVKLP